MPRPKGKINDTGKEKKKTGNPYIQAKRICRRVSPRVWEKRYTGDWTRAPRETLQTSVGTRPPEERVGLFSRRLKRQLRGSAEKVGGEEQPKPREISANARDTERKTGSALSLNLGDWLSSGLTKEGTEKPDCPRCDQDFER